MWPDQSKLKEFYGNPDKNNDGVADSAWEISNIVKIIPPYPMVWSWSLEPVKTLRVHKKCSESLLSILAEIGKKVNEQDRRFYEIDRCGGVYNFRLMRGGSSLSVHSYGAAIDLSPVINGLGIPYSPKKKMMPFIVRDIFHSHGWKWGGLWSRPDAMHFEAVNHG